MESNPFKEFIEDADPFDTWEGRFECHFFRCHSFANEAHYFKEDKRLMWTCELGHENKMENVDE